MERIQVDRLFTQKFSTETDHNQLREGLGALYESQGYPEVSYLAHLKFKFYVERTQENCG